MNAPWQVKRRAQDLGEKESMSQTGERQRDEHACGPCTHTRRTRAMVKYSRHTHMLTYIGVHMQAHMGTCCVWVQHVCGGHGPGWPGQAPGPPESSFPSPRPHPLPSSPWLLQASVPAPTGVKLTIRDLGCKACFNRLIRVLNSLAIWKIVFYCNEAE